MARLYAGRDIFRADIGDVPNGASLRGAGYNMWYINQRHAISHKIYPTIHSHKILWAAYHNTDNCRYISKLKACRINTKTNTGWRRHVHNGVHTMLVHILLRYVPRAENIILAALRME